MSEAPPLASPQISRGCIAFTSCEAKVFIDGIVFQTATRGFCALAPEPGPVARPPKSHLKPPDTAIDFGNVVSAASFLPFACRPRA